MFFVYIIRSKTSGTYYIGQTNNLERRVRRHNLGYEKYTRKALPWELVYHECYPTRSQAMSREKKLKKIKKRKVLEKLFIINS